MRTADLALEHANPDGSGQFATGAVRSPRASDMHAVLREAIGRRELYLEFQPIVQLDTGELVRLEALLRWNSRRFGRVPPGQFIPVAESCGAIDEIGEWVIQEGCRQIERWHSHSGVSLPLSINVSPHQLHRADFASRVLRLVEHAGGDPRWLELELTETALIENVAQARATLDALVSAGMRVAIDDFGSGHASISYLRDLPIHHIKLDRALTGAAGVDACSLAIIRAVARLARELDLSITAEGVEHGAQRDRLRRFRGMLGQGFLYAAPLPAAAIARWLRQASSQGDGRLVFPALA